MEKHKKSRRSEYLAWHGIYIYKYIYSYLYLAHLKNKIHSFVSLHIGTAIFFDLMPQCYQTKGIVFVVFNKLIHHGSMLTFSY